MTEQIGRLKRHTFKECFILNHMDMFGARAGIRCKYTGVWLVKPLDARAHAEANIPRLMSPMLHATVEHLTPEAVKTRYSKNMA